MSAIGYCTAGRLPTFVSANPTSTQEPASLIADNRSVSCWRAGQAQTSTCQSPRWPVPCSISAVLLFRRPWWIAPSSRFSDWLLWALLGSEPSFRTILASWVHPWEPSRLCWCPLLYVLSSSTWEWNIRRLHARISYISFNKMRDPTITFSGSLDNVRGVLLPPWWIGFWGYTFRSTDHGKVFRRPSSKPCRNEDSLLNGKTCEHTTACWKASRLLHGNISVTHAHNRHSGRPTQHRTDRTSVETDGANSLPDQVSCCVSALVADNWNVSHESAWDQRSNAQGVGFHYRSRCFDVSDLCCVPSREKKLRQTTLRRTGAWTGNCLEKQESRSLRPSYLARTKERS